MALFQNKMFLFWNKATRVRSCSAIYAQLQVTLRSQLGISREFNLLLSPTAIRRLTIVSQQIIIPTYCNFTAD